MSKSKIPNERHFEHRLFVQKLASDFKLEDVWELPIKLGENDSLEVFTKNVIQPMVKGLFNANLSGSLFRLRAVFGKVFKVDKNVNKLPIPGCNEVSLKERMNEEERKQHDPNLQFDISTDNFLDFRGVYSFKNETLHELSNATEHSLMHYARIANPDGSFKIHLSVYVKHRNWRGNVYMKLIKPFRHFIVYPYVMNECVRLWNLYKNCAK